MKFHEEHFQLKIFHVDHVDRDNICKKPQKTTEVVDFFLPLWICDHFHEVFRNFWKCYRVGNFTRNIFLYFIFSSYSRKCDFAGAKRATIQRAAQLEGGNFQRLFRTPNLTHFHQVPLSPQKGFFEMFFCVFIAFTIWFVNRLLFQET